MIRCEGLSAPKRQTIEEALQRLVEGWGHAQRVGPALSTLNTLLGEVHDERIIPARAGLNTVSQWLSDLEEHDRR